MFLLDDEYFDECTTTQSRPLSECVEITPELIAQHGLLPEEYDQILEILGRTPNLTELGIFSVMWSEHCAYKNTRKLLRLFPTEKKDKDAVGQVLVKAGEKMLG